MNTQSFLFENSSQIPEGIYIELMNRLKLDFEKKESEPELSVVVIDRNIPETIAVCKNQLIDSLIKKSETFENRTDMPNRTQFIQDLMRADYKSIKLLCKTHRIPLRKQNPDWKRQSDAVVILRTTHAAAWSQQKLLNP